MTNDIVKRKRGSLLYDTHPDIFAQISDSNKLSDKQKMALTTGCDKKLEWVCDRSDCETKHTWPACINKRTKGQGCPFCSGHKTCFCHSISATHPQLSTQLCDRLNGTWNATNLSASSSREDIYWQCDQQDCETEHIWPSTVSNRTHNNQGCPFCSRPRKKICFCQSLSGVYPEIAATLHPTRNGDLDASTISPGCTKVLWWIKKCDYCEEMLEWDVAPYNRIKCNGGSALCKCRSIGVRDPLLASQIDQELFPCDTMKLAACSNVVVPWNCDKHGSWKSNMDNRFRRRKGCPGCNEFKLEVTMRKALTDMGLKFKPQFSLPGSKQTYDFAILDDDDKPIWLTELDGIQHFEPTTFGCKSKTAEKMFHSVRQRDSSKDVMSQKHRVHLLRIPHIHNKVDQMKADIQHFLQTVSTFERGSHIIMCVEGAVYEQRDERYGIFEA
jgi:Probable Zinc-ribbon domain